MHMIKNPSTGLLRLLGPTLSCVVSGALMELTPLSYVLLLRSVVLFLRLWQVVLGHPALALSFS